MTTAIVLFRRDLRLADHPALVAACASHAHILPVYVHAPDEPASGKDDPWPAGAASRWWLHHALSSLEAQLHRRQASLHVRQGETLSVLLQLIKQSGAKAVYWNRLYEPAAIARDKRIKTALREQGIEVHSHAAGLWSEPWQISTQQGEPYRVFTPYWRNLRSQLNATAPLPEPSAPEWLALPGNVPLSALNLLPRSRWDNGLA
jgi:deoxyribodipyrimidine photo-lyase